MAAQREADRLRAAIAARRQELADVNVKDLVSESKKRELFAKPADRRTLSGHHGRVHAMHWAGDSLHVVSASQDGKLIIWNADTTNKLDSITLRSPWVLTCAYETTHNRMVACGGLDNNCSLYRIGDDVGSQKRPPAVVLSGHDGYLSCCRFVNDKTILTSSGDSTCILWDIPTRKEVTAFHDHQGDVTRISLSPTDPNVFVSGSCDGLAKVWDIRAGACTMTFDKHDNDVNDVDFMSNGTVFATASEDSSCCLFDLRANSEILTFIEDDILGGAMAVTFSKSGRIVFAGYDDFSCLGWDVLAPESSRYALTKHKDRITCLGVSPDGHALCTGSWDNTLLVRGFLDAAAAAVSQATCA